MTATHDQNPVHPDGDRDDALAVRLTAHALGQLAGPERDDLERLLADPAAVEARRDLMETRTLAAALRGMTTEPDVPRSPALRQAVLAACVRPEEGGVAAGRAGEPAVPPLTTPEVRDASGRRSQQADGGTRLPQHDAATGRNKTRDGFVSGGPGRWLLAAGGLAVALSAVLLVPVRPRTVAVRDSVMRGDSDARVTDRVAAADPRPQQADELQAGQEFAPAAAAAAPAEIAAPGKPSRRLVREAIGEVRRAEGETAAGVAARGSAAGSAGPPQMSQRAAAPAAPAARAFAEKAFDERREQDGVNGFAASSREAYADRAENGVTSVATQPLSTFSIDVDTASYANVRRFLTAGRLPPPNAVRIEEFINSFRYGYPEPVGDAPFAVALEAAECPWSEGRRLVRVGLRARDVDRRERPASNLVFLVDVSGSMADADKLPLVKQALAMLVEELGVHDRVAIVTYAGDAGLRLPGTGGDQKDRILAAIESLSAGGSTHGSAGIRLAYEEARAHFIQGGVNRVILATDGDLNVGVTDTRALVDLVREQAGAGTFLTVLGCGGGNLQDDKLERIADEGNGVYAYLDGLREARKVLVEQLTGSTITVAKDVKIQVEFNPAVVASYRLVGYENRVLATRDFRDDRKDAGDIGAGHTVTALYELSLVDEAADVGTEPLKYQPAAVPTRPRTAAPASAEVLTVKIRWKRPEGATSTLVEVPLTDRGGRFDRSSADLRFAAAVAAFGLVLRGSEARGTATLDFVARTAAAALGSDPGGYRTEFLDLVRKARALRGE